MTKDSIVEYLKYIKTYEIKDGNNVQMIAKIIESVAFDYDENVDKLQKLMNSWKLSDKKDKENYLNKKNVLIELLKLESEILFEFGHKYSQMKMNIKHPVSILYNKEVTNTMNANGAYSPSNNSIKYNLSIIQPSSAAVLGTVFHEMRHAKQCEFISYKDDDIFFDPLFIIMAKEKVLRDKDVINYEINHENFLEENDANLYGKYILTELSEKCLNRLYENEVLQNAFDKDEQKNLSNYGNGQLFGNGEDMSYNSEKNNNRIITTDKIVKKIIKENPNLLYKYPILRYVYNYDGTSKTYEQIIKEKSLLFEKHKDNKILETDAYSYTNYISSSSKTEKEQIESIYSLIISSDPILWVEDCINKKAFKRIIDMLEDNELIADEYQNELLLLINKYKDIDPSFISKYNSMLGKNNLNIHDIMTDELKQQQTLTSTSNQYQEQTDFVDMNEKFSNEFCLYYINKYKIDEVWNYRKIYDYSELDDDTKEKLDAAILDILKEELSKDDKYIEKKLTVSKLIEKYFTDNTESIKFNWDDLFDKFDQTENIEKSSDRIR